MACICLADEYFERNLYEKAEKYFLESLQLPSNPYYKMRTMTTIGKCMVNHGEKIQGV